MERRGRPRQCGGGGCRRPGGLAHGAGRARRRAAGRRLRDRPARGCDSAVRGPGRRAVDRRRAGCRRRRPRGGVDGRRRDARRGPGNGRTPGRPRGPLSGRRRPGARPDGRVPRDRRGQTGDGRGAGRRRRTGARRPGTRPERAMARGVHPSGGRQAARRLRWRGIWRRRGRWGRRHTRPGGYAAADRSVRPW